MSITELDFQASLGLLANQLNYLSVFLPAATLGNRLSISTKGLFGGIFGSDLEILRVYVKFWVGSGNQMGSQVSRVPYPLYYHSGPWDCFFLFRFLCFCFCFLKRRQQSETSHEISKFGEKCFCLPWWVSIDDEI